MRIRPYPAPPHWADLPVPRPTVGPGRRRAHRVGQPRRPRPGEWVIRVVLLPLLPRLAVLVGLDCLLSAKGRAHVRGEPAAVRHPVRVETHRFPVHPGDEMALLVLQPRDPRPESMTVHLARTERARAREGIDTETATEIVARHPVELDPPPEPGRPVAPETRGRVRLPADAMHSFAGGNHEIERSVEVERTFPGAATVTATRPLVVTPPSLTAVAAGDAPAPFVASVGPGPAGAAHPPGGRIAS